MKPGIKVGYQDGIEILNKTQAKYCEVYFRLDWQEQYTPLFKYLKQKKIAFGLHYWDMIEGRFLPNLLYLDPDFAQKTYQSIKKTINIAGKYGAYYVNFHPESYRQSLIDLDKKKIKTIGLNKKLDKEASFKQLLFYLAKIKKEADNLNVLALLETVPKYIVSDFGNIAQGRLKPQKSEGLETENFFKLAKLDYKFCFDIGHSLGQCLSEDKDRLFSYLYNTAKTIAANIRLFHITTNKPPFNGTDSHNGILAKDFKQGVVPNKKQFIKLLRLFKNKDVWLIPEPPMDEMIANYSELKKIVKKIEGN